MSRCALTRGRRYRLTGLRADLWQVPHPDYGQPPRIDAIFCGAVSQVVGDRTWYCFEVRVVGTDGGMMFIPNADLDAISLEELHAPDGPGGSRLRRKRGPAGSAPHDPSHRR